MRERVLLHFREAKNTGGEERVHGRGNGRGLEYRGMLECILDCPDRRDVVPVKIGTSRRAVP